jgi:hypothetical protein
MAEYDAFLKRDEASPQKRRPTTAPAALDQQPGGERKPSVKEIIRSSRAARAGKLKKGIEVQRGRAALTAAPPDPPPRVEPKRRRELLSWLLARRLRAWRRRMERRALRAVWKSHRRSYGTSCRLVGRARNLISTQVAGVAQGPVALLARLHRHRQYLCGNQPVS